MHRRFPVAFASSVLVLACLAGSAAADLVPGLLNDFEDGTLGGWDPPVLNTTNVPSGGVPGLGDRVLEIAAAPSTHLAAFTTDVAGVIDPDVTDVQVDMMRPSGQPALAMRLVLMGPTTGDRWTSTTSVAVPGNGVWQRYTFSILEADLTRVLGLSSYAALAADLDRMLLRHDFGEPSAMGTTGMTGVLLIDNVFVVPEPSAGWLGATSLLVLARCAAARRRA